MALSADSETVVAGGGSSRSVLVDVDTGIAVASFRGTNAVLSRDGASLLVAATNNGLPTNEALLYDVPTGVALQVFKHPGGRVNALAISADQTSVATATIGTPEVRVWDARTGALVRAIPQAGSPTGVAFAPDGTRVAVAIGRCGGFQPTASQKRAHVFDMRTGNEVLVLSGHASCLTAIEFSPDGFHILTGSEDHTAKLWDATSGAEIRTFAHHVDQVLDVSFSPDGARVLAGSSDGTATLWNRATGVLLGSLSGHEWAGGVGFSRDGRRIVTAGTGYADATIRLWDAESLTEIRRLEGITGSLGAVSVDGTKLLTVAAALAPARFPQFKARGIVGELATGRVLASFVTGGVEITSSVFSPDGTRIFTGMLDGSVRMWDAVTGDELRKFVDTTNFLPITNVAVSPDETRVAATKGGASIYGDPLGAVTVWDTQTTARLLKLSPISCTYANAVAFSPDSRRIATGSGATHSCSDGTQLWDAATGQQLRRFTGQGNAVTSVAFSPDGKWLAAGGTDYTTRIWDVESGAEIQRLAGHSAPVWSLSWSLDGTRLLTASGSDGTRSDFTVRMWDTSSGAELRRFANAFHPAVLLPSGDRMVSNSAEVSIWDALPPVADLSVASTAPADPVSVGSDLRYTHEVTNSGPSVATGVMLIQTLPAGVTLRAANSDSGACPAAGRTVTCGLGTLTPGGRAAATVVVRPSGPGTLRSETSVVGNQPDTQLDNNTVETFVTVMCPPCDDGDPCTVDSCGDPQACPTHVPIPGCCAVDADCDDGDLCTGIEMCRDHVCVKGPPPTCEDGNPCTDNRCDPASGCSVVLNTAPCDDRNACTTADRCQGGTCTGGRLLTCDDRDACTLDGCDPSSGCVHTPVTSCSTTTTSTSTTSSTTRSIRTSTTTSTTSTTRLGVTTTSTTTTVTSTTGPLQEVCDNCADDNGDALVDFEDAGCCKSAAVLHVMGGRFVAGHRGISEGRFGLRAVISGQAPPAGGSDAVDVTLHLRNSSGELLCAHLPGTSWRRQRRRFVFRDPSGQTAGLRRGTWRIRRDGSVMLSLSGSRIDLRRYLEPQLMVTLRAGSRCGSTTVPLRSTSKGEVYP